MGNISNKMVIVYDYDECRVEKMREDAIKYFDYSLFSEFGQYDRGFFEENMISPILKSFVNDMSSFIIMGDCSKAGWDTSETFKEIRERWIGKWSHNCYRIVELVMDEYGICCITD